MKTQYKFIYFVKIADKPKTSVWECRNDRSNITLGIVKYYPAWRQYCFFPEPRLELIFNDGCLKDMCDFFRQLKEERR